MHINRLFLKDGALYHFIAERVKADKSILKNCLIDTGIAWLQKPGELVNWRQVI